jgi:hypothetical protein
VVASFPQYCHVVGESVRIIDRDEGSVARIRQYV